MSESMGFLCTNCNCAGDHLDFVRGVYTCRNVNDRPIQTTIFPKDALARAALARPSASPCFKVENFKEELHWFINDSLASCTRDSQVRALLDTLLEERKNNKISHLDYSFIVLEVLRKIEKLEEKVCELFASNNFYVERYRAEVKKNEQPSPAQAARKE